LVAGILHSSGDAVVSLDADLQDPPELIEEMINRYRMGNDIVYAARRERPIPSLKDLVRGFFTGLWGLWARMSFMTTPIIE
jgi:glycosyltransferase involved in cell wall biosynthesis